MRCGDDVQDRREPAPSCVATGPRLVAIEALVRDIVGDDQMGVGVRPAPGRCSRRARCAGHWSAIARASGWCSKGDSAVPVHRPRPPPWLSGMDLLPDAPYRRVRWAPRKRYSPSSCLWDADHLSVDVARDVARDEQAGGWRYLPFVKFRLRLFAALELAAVDERSNRPAERADRRGGASTNRAQPFAGMAAIAGPEIGHGLVDPAPGGRSATSARRCARPRAPTGGWRRPEVGSHVDEELGQEHAGW